MRRSGHLAVDVAARLAQHFTAKQHQYATLAFSPESGRVYLLVDDQASALPAGFKLIGRYDPTVTFADLIDDIDEVFDA